MEGMLSKRNQRDAFNHFSMKKNGRAVEGTPYFASPLLYKENGFKKKEDAEALIRAMKENEPWVLQVEKIEKKVEKASMEFCAGKLNGQEAVVVRSGIGKVNAGICTQILVDLFEVDAVINTGIAGSSDARIDIGDLVISTDALHHDMDAVNFGYELGQIPRMDTLAFPADEKLIETAAQVCAKVNPDIRTWTGRVVSGDQFISDKATKDRIISNFGGFCTEMEGAAIAQAAYLFCPHNMEIQGDLETLQAEVESYV